MAGEEDTKMVGVEEGVAEGTTSEMRKTIIDGRVEECPVKEEDELFSTRENSTGIPDRECDCGHLCKVKREKRGQFEGHMYYCCPLKWKSCGYFKWVDESKANYDHMKYYCARGGICISCGRDGHWAIDCTFQPFQTNPPLSTEN